VEYQELHRKIVKEQEITWAERKTKAFPEGLVYSSKRCSSKGRALEKTLPFEFGSFFVLMDKAKKKLENLDIRLDCPEDGEPIPRSMHGFRDDIENQDPMRKGGYIIVLLPKLRTKEERLKAIPSIIADAGKNELPLLYELINKERRQLGFDEITR
jgi:hypothetical protein